MRWFNFFGSPEYTVRQAFLPYRYMLDGNAIFQQDTNNDTLTAWHFERDLGLPARLDVVQFWKLERVLKATFTAYRQELTPRVGGSRVVTEMLGGDSFLKWYDQPLSSQIKRLLPVTDATLQVVHETVLTPHFAGLKQGQLTLFAFIVFGRRPLSVYNLLP